KAKEEPEPALCVAPSQCQAVASMSCFITPLVCNHLNGDNHSTGCAWTGTSPLRPVLVR
ncbi:MAG: hypothetical protein H6Q88_3545, partial [Anaeromyxobacteraceae bacterium]|nr:hypothetical protein [Anaeromyxobacteraceae bacterium]